MTIPRVICAICQKPVDRLATWYDQKTGEHVLRAYCHGDKDTMKVGLQQLTPGLLKQLEGAEGVAFSVKRIAGEGQQEKGK